MASSWSNRALVLALLGVAFAAGVVYGAWRAVRTPIDEYHAARMDIEQQLGESKGVDDGE